MSFTIRSFLLIAIFSLVFAGCSTNESASPESTGEGSDATEAVERGTSKAAEKVSEGVRTAGEATGKALQTAGEATGRALQTAGEATKDAGETAGEAVVGEKKEEKE